MTEKICHARFLRENTAKNPLSCMCSKTNTCEMQFLHYKFTVKQFFLAIADVVHHVIGRESRLLINCKYFWVWKFVMLKCAQWKHFLMQESMTSLPNALSIIRTPHEKLRFCTITCETATFGFVGHAIQISQEYKTSITSSNFPDPNIFAFDTPGDSTASTSTASPSFLARATALD